MMGGYIVDAPDWVIHRVNRKLDRRAIAHYWETDFDAYYVKKEDVSEVEEACKEIGYPYEFIKGWAE